jgi:hypothetical protein
VEVVDSKGVLSMRPLKIVVICLLLGLGVVPGSSAYFIEDDVTLEYWQFGAPRESQTVTIADGLDDAVLLETNSALLNVDADRLTIEMVRNNAFPASGLFWGFKVLGLENQENPDWILLGVSIETNLPSWSEDRFEVTNDENGLNLAFDFEGMSLPLGRSLTAVFEFGPNPIPIPATAALFVTGLVGFAIVRKRIRN